MVCVLGLFIPSAAAPLSRAGNVTRVDEREGKYVTTEPEDVSFDRERCCELYSRKARRWDSVIPGL